VRAARNSRDARHRAGRLGKIRSEMYKFPEVPKENVFPGFGPLPGVDYEEYVAVLLPREEIRQFVLKLVRGLALKLDGLYLSEHLEIHCYPFEGDGEPWINSVLANSATDHKWGDSISLCRAVTPEDPQASLAQIEFWGRFKFYAIVRPTAAGGVSFH
jgi:hypothetical protein